MMNKIRNFPEFTHFACLPFILPTHRQSIRSLQQSISSILQPSYHNKEFVYSNYKLAHITISMLVLHREDTRQSIVTIMNKIGEQLQYILRDAFITFSRVNYFSRLNPKTKRKEVTLLYLEIQKDEHFKKVEKATDIFIREMLKSQIISPAQLKQMRIRYDHNDSLYKNQEYHLTLFRVNNVEENQHFQALFKEITKTNLQKFECRTFDISTRNSYLQNGFYTPFYEVPLIKGKPKQQIIDIQE